MDLSEKILKTPGDIADCYFSPLSGRPLSRPGSNGISKSVFCDMPDPLVLSGTTFVVVEDHPDTRFFISKFLLLQGAIVFPAPDAFEGLQAVREHRPDVVLSDISMPNRDGFELLGDIRALGPENGGSVPVIAMTAFGTTVDRNMTIAAGFKVHLDKPFTPQKLLEVIQSILKD
jgi:CheY-like chemotaxis protein